MNSSGKTLRGRGAINLDFLEPNIERSREGDKLYDALLAEKAFAGKVADDIVGDLLCEAVQDPAEKIAEHLVSDIVEEAMEEGDRFGDRAYPNMSRNVLPIVPGLTFEVTRSGRLLATNRKGTVMEV